VNVQLDAMSAVGDIHDSTRIKHRANWRDKTSRRMIRQALFA
jgi:hypothetical protein